MKRVRFFVPYSAEDLAKAEQDPHFIPDTRPLKYPTPYPSWCSGTSFEYDVYVAWTPEENHEAYIREYWPEAKDLDVMQEGIEISFTSRFARVPGVYDEHGRAYHTPRTTDEVGADALQSRGNARLSD